MIQSFLEKVVVPGEPERDASKNNKINGWDIAVIIIFLLFSGFYFLSRLQYGFPLTQLGGDAANIASFAAAFDHPDQFRGDELLSNLDNIRIYNTIHIPLIRWLRPLTGSYGLAFQVMLGPNIFIYLLGLYFFGRVWFKSRYWSFVFAVIGLFPFSFVLGEGWGIFNEPIPRFSFQALFPILLALIWIWRDRIWLWPLLMFFAGLLVYVHPVSTPAWIAAMLLGFWILMPPHWRIGKRLAILFGLSIAAILAIFPFILNYLRYHVQGNIADFSLVMTIIQKYFPENLLNPPAAIVQFLKDTFLLGILPLSILGFILVWVLGRHDRTRIYLVLAWMAGLLLVSLVVPITERIVERIFHLVPFQTELLRGIRYYIFFMELFIIWALSELSLRLKNRWIARAVMALGCILVVIALIGIRDPSIPPTLACLRQGKLICYQPNSTDQLIEAIQNNTPPEARFYYSNTAYDSSTIIIRYLAERSLVYNVKDRGLLVYSNSAQLRNWYDTIRKVSRYKSPADWLIKNPDDFLQILNGLKADYLIVSPQLAENSVSQLPVKIVFQNSDYTVLDLRPNDGQPWSITR